MNKKPRKKRTQSYYPKIPIGIAWAADEKEDAEIKLKVVNNRNIDEIMDLNYNLPGIPEDAVIKHVVMGKTLIEDIKEKYNIE